MRWGCATRHRRATRCAHQFFVEVFHVCDVERRDGSVFFRSPRGIGALCEPCIGAGRIDDRGNADVLRRANKRVFDLLEHVGLHQHFFDVLRIIVETGLGHVVSDVSADAEATAGVEGIERRLCVALLGGGRERLTFDESLRSCSGVDHVPLERGRPRTVLHAASEAQKVEKVGLAKQQVNRATLDVWTCETGERRDNLSGHGITLEIRAGRNGRVLARVLRLRFSPVSQAFVEIPCWR